MGAARPRFTDLLERHEREIYRYAHRMMGNPEDAADVLQETFLRRLGLNSTSTISSQTTTSSTRSISR